MSDAITISVVIPCYNCEPFLQETLESVLGQTYPIEEVLVVDDGSTDNSTAVARSFGKPVRVIEQKNQGVSAARNRGIEAASGEWIAFVDADDVWKPEKLTRQVQLIDQSTVGLHTSYYNFGNSSGVADFSDVSPDVRYSLEFVANHSPLNTSTLMVRNTTSPRFPVWAKYAEDTVFQLELVQRGTIKLAAEPLVGYRRHAASATGASSLTATSAIHRHETIIKWVEFNQKNLSAEEYETIRHDAVRKLFRAALGCKWNRDWKNFHSLRAYLQQYETDPVIAEFLRKPVLPRFFYFAKDCLSVRK